MTKATPIQNSVKSRAVPKAKRKTVPTNEAKRRSGMREKTSSRAAKA